MKHIGQVHKVQFGISKILDQSGLRLLGIFPLMSHDLFLKWILIVIIYYYYNILIFLQYMDALYRFMRLPPATQTGSMCWFCSLRRINIHGE